MLINFSDLYFISLLWNYKNGFKDVEDRSARNKIELNKKWNGSSENWVKRASVV